MMKKITLLLLCMIAMLRASAVPAYPYPVTVAQPDGTMLEIQGQGDEFYHFTTTADGYTVVKNDAGYYVYAQLSGNQLVATSRIAHNPDSRTAADVAWLNATGKMLTEQTSVNRARKLRRQVAAKATTTDYQKFRGLVVLVNFTDRKFSRSDVSEHYKHMFNDDNYAGYTNEDGTRNAYGSMFIGGVRDYFRQNSMGKFAPQFDVVGPVDVNMKSTDMNGSSDAYKAFMEALQNADDLVDYSKYDSDGDGQVDMVYFIVAGYGSSYSGNNSGYLWAHKWSLEYTDMPMLDGVRFGVYACSVEFYGWEAQDRRILDGIGTICHEFSHVLGLPDEYDTDYATNGQSHHPGSWSVMAGGSYNQYGRLPVGYSAYERYSAGFLTPKVIDKDGTYELKPLNTANEALIIKTPVEKEYFMLENRQQTGWDQALPGHGMLVFRVDSTNEHVWIYNTINANPNHNYYELLRAGGGTSGESPADAFPGTAGVTVLSRTTIPSLSTWDGTGLSVALTDIAENGGIISFKAREDGTMVQVKEDFETIGAAWKTGTFTGATNVKGRFCPWDFVKCGVTAPAAGSASDTYSVAMRKPSAVATAESLPFFPFMMSAHFFNPSNTTAKFAVQFSPNGKDWQTLSSGSVSVPANSDLVQSFNLNEVTVAAYYRVSQVGGSNTTPVYVDDITFSYYKIIGDVNDDRVVDVTDVTALINNILGTEWYDTNFTDINADGKVDVSDVTALVQILLAE